MSDFHKFLKFLVPGAGVEPARGMASRDFKSLMSTSSITQARRMHDSLRVIEGLVGVVNS